MKTFFNLVAKFFPKETEAKPARIPPQTPPAGGKIRRGFAKSFSPENSFGKTESALKPHALPKYLEGRTPKKNVLSIFKKKFTPAKSKKQETFFFGVAGVLASAWGFLRAYDLVSSHHALRACHIICFESKCELGTIETPIRNSTIFSVDSSGRRKAPTKDFPPFFQTNLESRLRRDGGFFRQEAGAKSEAILTKFALPEIQKEFLLL